MSDWDDDEEEEQEGGEGLAPYPVDAYYCPECRERERVTGAMTPEAITQIKALLDEHDRRLVAKLRAGWVQ